MAPEVGPRWKKRCTGTLATCSRCYSSAERKCKTCVRPPDSVELEPYSRDGGYLQRLAEWIDLRRSPPVPAFQADPWEQPPHTNASGDFLLMARPVWFELKGYRELTTHAHIDSIMVWLAKSAGLRQVTLGAGMRLYHQEHDRSSHKTMPQTDWRPWKVQFDAALERGAVMATNNDDWGLASTTLMEYRL